MFPASSIVKMRSGAGIACTIASANILISALDTIALCNLRELTNLNLDNTSSIVDMLTQSNPEGLGFTLVEATDGRCHRAALSG